jgi:hypothetical protein
MRQVIPAPANTYLATFFISQKKIVWETHLIIGYQICENGDGAVIVTTTGTIKAMLVDQLSKTATMGAILQPDGRVLFRHTLHASLNDFREYVTKEIGLLKVNNLPTLHRFEALRV